MAGRHIGIKQMSGVFSYAALPDFGFDVGSWRLNCHLRFLGDATGDGCPDIVRFCVIYVLASRNTGNGSFVPAQFMINGFCCAADGWRVDQQLLGETGAPASPNSTVSPDPLPVTSTTRWTCFLMCRLLEFR